MNAIRKQKSASTDVFCVRPIKSKILSEVRAALSKFEEKYSLRFVLVANPYRPKFSSDDYFTFSLLVFPKAAGCFVEDKEGPQEFILEIKKFFESWAFDRGHWFCFSLLDYNGIFRWFERFKKKPEEFPLKDTASGCDLISPVIYGEVLWELMRECAKTYFGQNILRIWVESVPRLIHERNVKLRKIVFREEKYILERKSVLNRYEVAELRRLVFWVVKKFREGAYTNFVALDGSGRPIGKAIEWFTKGQAVVSYLAPHQLRRLDFRDEKKMSEAASVFRDEFPDVYQILVVAPEKVLFLDDQTGYGNTAAALKNFVETISGSDKIELAVMSQFAGTNTPSWLRKRDIQGIRIVSNRLTFSSVEKPTKKSIMFYGRLKKHVDDWGPLS